jgi:hypothetical protein
MPRSGAVPTRLAITLEPGKAFFAESMVIRTTPILVFVNDKGIILFYFMDKVKRYEQVEKGINSIMETTSPAVSTSPVLHGLRPG